MGKTDIGHLRPVLSTPIYLHKITVILKIGNFRSIFICNCKKMNVIIFFQILHATFYISVNPMYCPALSALPASILTLLSVAIQIRNFLFAILFTIIIMPTMQCGKAIFRNATGVCI